MARTADWRNDLMRAHPRLFEIIPDEPERSFGYPLCEVGWRDVLERICARIENALKANETFEFVRIKQKFGVTRFDWYGGVSDETATRTHEAVNLAVARSACTCETCGAEGRLHSSRGWLATRCADHAAGDPMPVRAALENVRIQRQRSGAGHILRAV
jgi:hypothetical protein